MTTAGAIVAILSGAVIVLTGLVAVARGLWRAAQDLRDNKLATQANTRALADLGKQMDGRLTSLESRVAALEPGKGP